MDYQGALDKLVWNLTKLEPEGSEVYTDDALLEFRSPVSGSGKGELQQLAGRVPGGDLLRAALGSW